MKRSFLVLGVLFLFSNSTAFGQLLDKGWEVQGSFFHFSNEVREKNYCVVYDVDIIAGDQSWFDRNSQPQVSEVSYLAVIVEVVACGTNTPTMVLQLYSNPTKEKVYVQKSFVGESVLTYRGTMKEAFTGADFQVHLTLVAQTELGSTYGWTVPGEGWSYNSVFGIANSIASLSISDGLGVILRKNTLGTGSIEETRWYGLTQ